MARSPFIQQLQELPSGTTVGLYCEGHIPPEQFCALCAEWLRTEGTSYALAPPDPSEVSHEYREEVGECEVEGWECDTDECNHDRVWIKSSGGTPVTAWEW